MHGVFHLPCPLSQLLVDCSWLLESSLPREVLMWVSTWKQNKGSGESLGGWGTCSVCNRSRTYWSRELCHKRTQKAQKHRPRNQDWSGHRAHISLRNPKFNPLLCSISPFPHTSLTNPIHVPQCIQAGALLSAALRACPSLGAAVGVSWLLPGSACTSTVSHSHPAVHRTVSGRCEDAVREGVPCTLPMMVQGPGNAVSFAPGTPQGP